MTRQPAAADLARMTSELDALLEREPPLPAELRVRIFRARQAVAQARDLAFLAEPRPPPDGDAHDLDYIV